MCLQRGGVLNGSESVPSYRKGLAMHDTYTAILLSSMSVIRDPID
jgi:hypothetical protein